MPTRPSGARPGRTGKDERDAIVDASRRGQRKRPDETEGILRVGGIEAEQVVGDGPDLGDGDHDAKHGRMHMQHLRGTGVKRYGGSEAGEVHGRAFDTRDSITEV